jgi:hypothetical protein
MPPEAAAASQRAATHLELAVRAGDRNRRVVTHDLRGDHRQGLALGRVNLAGHDGRSGLVLGERELAEAAAGARGQVADVVGNLHERDGDRVERTRGLDDGVVGGKGLELPRQGRKREAKARKEERRRRGDQLVRASAALVGR